jgi:hypothetical protein
MIGPVLLHQKKTKQSYFTLSSQVAFEAPYISVFGTDGDEQLYGSFQVALPRAQHLLCDIHMKDNIEDKLSILKISDQIKIKIINMIFGDRIGILILQFVNKSIFFINK